MMTTSLASLCAACTRAMLLAPRRSVALLLMLDADGQRRCSVAVVLCASAADISALSTLGQRACCGRRRRAGQQFVFGICQLEAQWFSIGVPRRES